MEACITMALLSVFFGIIIGVIFALCNDDGAVVLIGAAVGIAMALFFIVFGCLIGPMECETPDTRIEIVSSEGEVTFSDEGDFKIHEIAEDYIKYEEDGEKITVYVEDGSKVKVIDLED